MAAEKRILLLLDNISNDHQQWRILFIKKDRNSLKETLEKEAHDKISARLLDYMFKKIVGEQ